MNNDKTKLNPFAEKDGSPKDGHEQEFFAWEQKNSKAELNKLPEEEQAKIIESEKALQKRMNS